MDEDVKRRFDSIEHKLYTMRDLIGNGLTTVSGLDGKVSALIDSQVKLYGSVERLSDSVQALSGSVQALSDSVQRLSEAQAETERRLQRLIDSLRHRNGGQPDS